MTILQNVSKPNFLKPAKGQLCKQALLRISLAVLTLSWTSSYAVAQFPFDAVFNARCPITFSQQSTLICITILLLLFRRENWESERKLISNGHICFEIITENKAALFYFSKIWNIKNCNFSARWEDNYILHIEIYIFSLLCLKILIEQTCINMYIIYVIALCLEYVYVYSIYKCRFFFF